MCINCMLCYSACPVYGLDPHFIGPAAIALAQRYNLDSRDEGASQRMEVLSAHDGIWGCTFVGECTKVCPKNVDPAGAIQRYKLTAAVETVEGVVHAEGRVMSQSQVRSEYQQPVLPPRDLRRGGGSKSRPTSPSSCGS